MELNNFSELILMGLIAHARIVCAHKQSCTDE